MRKLILLDLDNTLFDSGSFRKALFERIGKIYEKGNRTEEVAIICQEVADNLIGEMGLFDAEIFLERLSQRLGRKDKKDKVIKAIFDQEHIRRHLHQEVMKILRRLTKLGEVGILSQGEERLQRMKISSFAHLLNKKRIHISRNKKNQMSKILKLYRNYKIYFIDDMLPMLEMAKTIRPEIVSIWIKRGRYAQEQPEIPGFTPEAVIYNLREAIPIIKKLSLMENF